VASAFGFEDPERALDLVDVRGQSGVGEPCERSSVRSSSSAERSQVMTSDRIEHAFGIP
jgi:hypothetical protein